MAKKIKMFSYRYACEYCGHITPWMTKIGSPELKDSSPEERFQPDNVNAEQNRFRLPNAPKTQISVYKKAFAEGKYYLLNADVKCPSCKKVQYWSWDPNKAPKSFIEGFWFFAITFLIMLLACIIPVTIITLLLSWTDPLILFMMYAVSPFVLALVLTIAATTEANNIYHKNIHDFETVKAKNVPEVRWHEQNFEDMSAGPKNARRRQRAPGEPPPLWESLSANQNLLSSGEPARRLLSASAALPAEVSPSPIMSPPLSPRQSQHVTSPDPYNRRNPRAQEAAARKTAARNTVSKDAVARETTIRETAARKAAAREAVAKGAVAKRPREAYLPREDATSTINPTVWHTASDKKAPRDNIKNNNNIENTFSGKPASGKPAAWSHAAAQADMPQKARSFTPTRHGTTTRNTAETRREDEARRTAEIQQKIQAQKDASAKKTSSKKNQNLPRDLASLSGLAAPESLLPRGLTAKEPVAPTKGLPSRGLTPTRGLSSREPTPTRGLSSREPTPTRGLSSKEPTPTRGLSSKEPTPARGLSSKEPTPAKGLFSGEPNPAKGLSPREPAPSKGLPSREPTSAKGLSPRGPTPARGLPARGLSPREPAAPPKELSSREPAPARGSTVPRDAASRGLSAKGTSSKNFKQLPNDPPRKNREKPPGHNVPADTSKVASLWESTRGGSASVFDIPETPSKRRKDLTPHQKTPSADRKLNQPRETVPDRYRPVPWSSPPQEPQDELSARKSRNQRDARSSPGRVPASKVPMPNHIPASSITPPGFPPKAAIMDVPRTKPPHPVKSRISQPSSSLPNRHTSSSTYDVELTEVRGDMLQTMNVLRDITGLPFKETQRLMESAPRLLFSGVSQATAHSIKDRFKRLDAVISIRVHGH